uniref:Uncharacterized protein n=1 Tax=Cacopsylla melanoneura TaxID=428564 RepID=A0A8D9FCM6_9HEMI
MNLISTERVQNMHLWYWIQVLANYLHNDTIFVGHNFILHFEFCTKASLTSTFFQGNPYFSYMVTGLKGTVLNIILCTYSRNSVTKPVFLSFKGHFIICIYKGRGVTD